MGAGYEYIDHAMHEQYTWQVLAGLVLLKIVATALSFSSGMPGGLFAPVLFIGAMLGATVCGVERSVFPGVTGPMGAYALVGMGTMFAGILRAPMTSVFMIVEISGDYSIVLPVMISNTIAYLISRRFQQTPLFEVLSHQDGIVLPSMEEQREAAVQRVEHAMRGVDIVLSATDSAGRRAAAARRLARRAVPARAARRTLDDDRPEADAGGPAGGRARRSAAAGRDGVRPAAAVAPPDQPLDAALRVIGDRPLLPVVHRADARRLVGVVTLDNVLDAYRRGAGAGSESGRSAGAAARAPREAARAAARAAWAGRARARAAAGGDVLPFR